MFKVVFNNKIIDILDLVVYVRYLKKSNKFVNTDKTSADGIRSSNKETIYILEGRKCPQDKQLLTVQLIEINRNEYDSLKSLLENESKIDNNSKLLTQVRELKIEELSNACKNYITDGVDVLLSDSVYHNFRLTVEDQLNLSSIKNQLDSGIKRILYHETGKVVSWYSADDMRRIIECADRFKTLHTTYFNLLKFCINNMYTEEEISNVYYGIDLANFKQLKDINIDVKEYNIVKEYN